MADKWKDLGSSEGLGALIPGPAHRAVLDTESGKAKEVYVGNNQTVGEAIENGQFTGRDMSHRDKK